MLQKIIAIDASPNLKKEDVFLSLRLLFSPWTWWQHKNIDLLKTYFEKNYQPNLTLLCQSGRAALYLVISSIIKPEDEVITQAFTCLAVPNAILWAKGKVIFADIEKSYNIDPADLTKKITPKTKAVIIQHSFGIPANIGKIKEICKKNKLFLIEDCAHALGAKYKNKPAGTFGDAAIFSFNQDKVVSGVSGGVAIFYNKQLIENLKKTPPIFLNVPSLSILRILLHPLIWALALPLYESFNLGKGIIWLARSLKLTGNTITKEEENGQMPKHLLMNLSDPQAQLINLGLKRLEKENERRRQIARRYLNGLSSLPIVCPSFDKNSLPIFLRYPVQVKNQEELLKSARKAGIILGSWYKTPIFPWTLNAGKYYQKGLCLAAEKAAGGIVNLPTYPNLSDNEVIKIIQVVKSVCK